MNDISKQAKMFVASVAEDLDTKGAENANQYFLMGRTLLDKKAFIDINDDGYDPVHGFTVTYGPFDTKAAAQEFVSDYPENKWPGHNDWVLVRPGKAHILTHHFDMTNSDVVHNKTLGFQGQVMINEMQRRKDEIQEVKSITDELTKQDGPSNEQIKGLIDHYKSKIDNLSKQLE